ncbi:MAG: flagellar biosynthesis protein FlhB [bacterium]
MAESTGQERTESATPRRRQKAREEGNVARSMEVNSVIVLVAGLAGLAALGPRMTEHTGALTTDLFRALAQPLDEGLAVTLAHRVATTFAWVICPFAGVVALAGLGANLAQTGIVLSGKPLMPKPDRLSPLTGLKKIFSKRGMAELAKSLIKVAVVGAAVGWALFRTLESFFPLVGMEVAPGYAHIVSAMFTVAATSAAALALLAVLDFWFQRFEHEQQLKMTRQEVKDEYKQTEGDPSLKGKIRERQRQISRRRMMEDLKTADVVVTNPIRFAVALKYDPATMRAPRVVAMGARLLAARIREAARVAGIPIVENPPLARALFKAARVGGEVPVALYQAVAELLAFVWRKRDAHAIGGAR